MISIMDGNRGPAVVRKSSHLAVESRQIVDVDKKMECRNIEMMNCRSMPSMANVRQSHRRPHWQIGHRGHSTPRCAATRTADQSPSSWKPQRCQAPAK